MDADIKRLVDATGVSVPLAARIIAVIIDSGASHIEVSGALQIVNALKARLPISYRGEEATGDSPDVPSHS
jgi:hypothetical protein